MNNQSAVCEGGFLASHNDSPTAHKDAGIKRRKAVQAGMFSLFRLSALINALALAVIVGYLLYHGLPAINLEFLTQYPRNSMTAGGIMPCILGTILLSYGSLAIALPWGVATAVWLHEYARPGWPVHAGRRAIRILAGVPSAGFGLLGLPFFVIIMDMGVSLLAGCLTLGAYVLPRIIGPAEESLRQEPNTYREASLGLGATKWQTISKVVLPAAMSSMLTGAILGLSRAAGETAAIMFTAAVFYNRELPNSLFDSVMALPYHIFVLATAGTEIDKTRPLQYGTAVVLIALVLGMNLLAIIIRAKLRRRFR